MVIAFSGEAAETVSGVIFLNEICGIGELLADFWQAAKRTVNTNKTSNPFHLFIVSKLLKVVHFSGSGAQYIESINGSNFEVIALALFQYQYQENELYQRFVNALGIKPEVVKSIEQIPFLPISFFKTHEVKTGNWTDATLIFESSGTTGDIPSKHFVKDAAIYEASLVRGFEEVYDPVSNYAFVALLPSYLERSNASLVHMARVLINKSNHADSGFYLNEWDQLAAVLKKLIAQKQPTILLGVTFALLDFATGHPMELADLMVMETGGMKGRREEWTRTQVHELLQEQWQLKAVHSEYGMTELLSQAYAVKEGVFSSAATMRMLVRDLNDPLTVMTSGTGCANIIDLANVHSCAFIATDDIAHLRGDGQFEILGRADHTALRGCSLMTA